MSSVTKLLLAELSSSTTPTPGDSQLGKLYQQWSTCDGLARGDNLDIAVDEMLAVVKVVPDGKYLDVSKGMRKEAGSPERFEESVLSMAAERAARALVVLDIFGETGVIELQTAYGSHMEKILHDYEDRPPF